MPLKSEHAEHRERPMPAIAIFRQSILGSVKITGRRRNMFESEQSSNDLVNARWAVSVYGFCSFVGLCGGVAELWKHGISRPEQIAVAAAIFLLSLRWLGTTVRLGPPTKIKFGSHAALLLLLTGAASFALVFRQ
jgi:hypothetical protein